VLARAHAAGEFDGVVLVAEGGAVLYERGFGLADRATGAPNGPATRFPLASITKQVTALLVMQFVDEGRLDLDAPVGAVLPDFRGGRDEGVTARRLLTHTSGLPDVEAAPGFMAERDAAKLRPAAVLAGPLAAPLRSAPGEKFQYNNGDYWVLGAACERLGGAPFARLVERRVLGPAGMATAGVFEGDAAVAGLAQSYERGARGPALGARPANLYAAGALYGTARDVLRFDEALRSRRLLSARATDAMFTPDGGKGFVALGSWAYEHKFPRAAKAPLLIERQGEVNAFRHLNVIAPREGLVLVVLSNGGEPELFKLYADQGLSFELLSAAFDDGARAAR
jgi:CubicO group peptidase (beta-lactamase class C family)